MGAATEPARSSARRGAAVVSRLDLPLLDVLRILASFAVVHHHMRRDFLFGVGFGLPLFLVIMFGLVVSSSKNESVGDFVRRKARYLLVPWVRWSLIYIVIFAAADQMRGLAPWNRFERGMLFYGGEKSLWFLPFAALALWPLKWLSVRVAHLTPLQAALFAGMFGLLATCAATWTVSQSIPDMPVRTWLRVAPAIFWGLALGQSVRSQSGRERVVLLLCVSLLAAASCVLAPARNPAEDLPRRFAIAVALASIGFGWRVPVPDALRRLATATFGVYLIHPLVGSVLELSFDVLAWPAWLHAGAAWSLSILTVLALRRLGLGWHELFTGRGGVHDRPQSVQVVDDGRAQPIGLVRRHGPRD